MSILGVDKVVYGVDDLARCKTFFVDWGLCLKAELPEEIRFETLNGCEVRLRAKDDPRLPAAIEPGSTVRELVFGVETEADLAKLRSALQGARDYSESRDLLRCTDPNGMRVGFRVSRRRPIDVQGVPANIYGAAPRRINKASPIYERAEPIDIGHLVFFTQNLAEMEKFYVETLGFFVSDRYVGRALFLRCGAHGGHHDIFFLQLPNRPQGLNHVAFSVRDLHEVFGGGLHIGRCGWETDIGPGRHPVSSAIFWYVKCPAGGNVEYYTDEDHLTPEWQPRSIEARPESFAEWAVAGGIDGKTRRQRTGPISETVALSGSATRK